MKQFFVFIHSKFSEPSIKCESIIKSLPSELNINYLCVDNIENRKIIQQDEKLDIKLVPCLLVVNTEGGKIIKFEGLKCYDYLLQYQKQQTSLPEPQPMSMYKPMDHSPPPPPVQQQQPASPAPAQRPRPPQQQQRPPQQQQQQRPPPIIQKQPVISDDNDDFFNNEDLPDANQTSMLSGNDDDDETKEEYPITKSKGKPSLLAQATAMLKSRISEDDFLKKKL